MDKRYFYFFY